MNLSEHARVRCQQRGISLAHLKLISAFGHIERRPGNAMAMYLDRKGMRDLEKVLRDGLQNIDKLKGQVLIISDDETVITCYHGQKK